MITSACGPLALQRIKNNFYPGSLDGNHRGRLTHEGNEDSGKLTHKRKDQGAQIFRRESGSPTQKARDRVFSFILYSHANLYHRRGRIKPPSPNRAYFPVKKCCKISSTRCSVGRKDSISINSVSYPILIFFSYSKHGSHPAHSATAG